LKKGVQTAICCPCGNEKILALGLCATCYTLKRQDAEYFGGLEQTYIDFKVRKPPAQSVPLNFEPSQKN
jgi:hypothetical protein